MPLLLLVGRQVTRLPLQIGVKMWITIPVLNNSAIFSSRKFKQLEFGLLGGARCEKQQTRKSKREGEREGDVASAPLDGQARTN